MRTIQWTQFAPVGDGEVQITGTLDKFFLSGACSAIVYLGVVPPFSVLNNFLASGVSDQGMGGAWKWEPSSLTESEYHELACLLISAPPPQRMRAIECLSGVPDWVQDEHDFHAWLFHVPEQLYLPVSLERKRVLARIHREPNQQRRAKLQQELENLEAHGVSLYAENVHQRKCRVPSPLLK
jgi:hypothetical protein